MMKSAKAKKQRLHRATAPLHERQHFVHSHIDKSLKQKLGIKARAVRISKGDTVKLMAGAKRGTTGKVTSVLLSTGMITIDSLVRKNAKGKERTIPINAANVYITDLNLEDKVRAKKLGLQAQKRKAEEPKKPAEKQVEKQADKPAGNEKEVAAAQPMANAEVK